MILLAMMLGAAMAMTPEKVDDYIFRGPRPPSVRWLKENGFQEVIDLQSGIYEIFHDDDYESEKRSSSSLDRRDEKWSDFCAPSKPALMKVAFLLETNQMFKIKTYVHCAQGKDRTGMAIAAYKILVKDVPVHDAVIDMYKHGFHRFPYFFWVSQLENLK